MEQNINGDPCCPSLADKYEEMPPCLSASLKQSQKLPGSGFQTELCPFKVLNVALLSDYFHTCRMLRCFSHPHFQFCQTSRSPLQLSFLLRPEHKTFESEQQYALPRDVSHCGPIISLASLWVFNPSSLFLSCVHTAHAQK